MNNHALGKYKADERIRLECIKMLCSQEELSTYHFQYAFGVSRSTVLNDLKKADELAGKYGVCVRYSRQDGYYLQGNGDGVRALSYEIINFVGNTERCVRLISEAIGDNGFSKLYYSVRAILKDVLTLNMIQWRRAFIDRSACMLTLMCYYSKTKHYVPPCKSSNMHCCSKLSAVVENVLQELPCKVREEEKAFISVLVLNISRDIRLISSSIDKEFSEFEKYAAIASDRFACIMQMSSFSKYEQIINIACELQKIYFEHYYFLQFANSMCMDFRKHNEDLYSIVKLILRDVDDVLGFGPNEDELCALALSFVSALDEAERPIWISEIVFFSKDEGKREVFRNLSELFPELKLKWIKREENLLLLNANSYDLIISDQPLSIPCRKPFYLLTGNEDELVLRGKILDEIYGTNNKDGTCGDKAAVSDVIKQIKNYCDIRDEIGLTYAVKGMSPLLRQGLVKALGLPSLRDALRDQCIQFRPSCESWQEAIEKASEPLLELGYITAGYVDEMIQTIFRHGPYIAVYPGFALPHALSYGNVKQVGFSFLHLDTPVWLPGSRKNEIRILIVVATVNNTMHKRALGELASILECSENRTKLLESKDIDTVKQILF